MAKWAQQQLAIEDAIRHELDRIRCKHARRQIREEEMVSRLETDPRRRTIDGIPEVQWMSNQPLRIVNLYCKQRRVGLLTVEG